MDAVFPRPPVSIRASAGSGRSLALLLLLLICATGLRLWLPRSLHTAWLTSVAVEPYQELTKGIMAGNLSLPRVPDQRLVALANPYDPEQNAPYRVANLSYFKGRYYLYLGIAPVLTLFVPVHWLTGLFLTQRAAIAVFCGLGSTAGIWLLWFVRRRWLTNCSLPTVLACGCAWLFADGYWVVLGSGSTANGVAIAGAYGFGMIGLAACAVGMARTRGWPWLAVGGFCFGLTVASRPNYLFAAVALVFFMAIGPGAEDSPASGVRRKLKFWSLALPLTFASALVLAYNLARFGQPWEFGQSYMLGEWNQTRLPPFGIGSALLSLKCYLWRPDRLSAAFPFLRSPDEFATGVLCNAPWVWLTPIAGWAWITSPRSSSVRCLASGALAWTATNLLTLIFLPSGDLSGRLNSANSRYTFDFQPALMLFVCLGAMMASDRLSGRGSSRRILSLGLSILAFLSVLAAVSLQFQPLPPESYRAFAGIMNQPTLLYERWTGQGYGPIAFDVTFPDRPTIENDPLVDTGQHGASDLIYVQYLDVDHVRFGLAREGAAGPIGPPVAISHRAAHRMEIWMGSLLPPAGDPAMAQLSDAAASILKRRVRVVLDGRTVLDDLVNCHSATPREVWVGSCPVTPGFTGSRFQGRLGSTVRLPIRLPTAEIPPPVYGDLALEVRFPANDPSTPEPLVATGIAGAADVVYLKYLSADRIQIGYDHWGYPGVLSPPLPIDRASSHRIVVRLSSLHAPAGPPAAGQPGAATYPADGVALDGREVLAFAASAYPSSPYDVAICRNPIGASTCGYAFSGQIIRVSRLPEAISANRPNG